MTQSTSLNEPAHQPALDDFDEQQIGDNHSCKEEEDQTRQRCKAKRTGKWSIREYDPHYSRTYLKKQEAKGMEWLS